MLIFLLMYRHKNAPMVVLVSQNFSGVISQTPHPLPRGATPDPPQHGCAGAL